MNTVNSFTPEHERLIREIAQHVGFNLFVYQEIEISLKIMLPHMTRGRTEFPYFDVIRQASEKKKKKKKEKQLTLGPLFETLKERVESGQKESFDLYLRTIATHRNELIHPVLVEGDRPRRATVEDCNAELELLKSRYQFALPLRSILRGFAQAFIISVDEREVHESPQERRDNTGST